MQTTFFTDGGAFADAALPLLERQELQNNVLIKIAAGARENRWPDGVFACAGDDNGIRLVAAMTPPQNIVMYAVDNRIDIVILRHFAEELHARGIQPPGVMADIALAAAFAEAYTAAAGRAAQPGQSMRIYQLERINPDLPAVPGAFRPAAEADMRFLGEWLLAFELECGIHHGASAQSLGEDTWRQIQHESVFVWDDPAAGGAVTSARYRTTKSAGIVAAVYTPPHFRGRGYATACVAALSRRILEGGFARCALYADKANPISNAVYQKIGYTVLCDADEWRFS